MKINIFGKIYKVEVVKELNTSGVANCDYGKRLIKIKSTLSNKFKDECLVHEMIHAVFDRIGVGSTKLHPDFEEIICDSIAKVISENFKLVKRGK